MFTSHTLTKQQPKKSAMANGHGKRGTAKSSPIITQSKSEDAAAAAKRKRKPKKPYLVMISPSTGVRSAKHQ